jgi:hypothetical protein
MPVVVEGVPELKRALKKFAPDLRKEMYAEIRVALKEVRDDARSKIPGVAPGGLYNWNDTGKDVNSRTSKTRSFPQYNAALIRRGITYKMGATKRNRQGFSALYSLFNSDASGVIAEWAGRVNRDGRKQMGNRGSKSTQIYGRSNNPDAGRRFVHAMNGIGPLKQYDKFSRGRGRILYAAYADNSGKALDSVMKAIDKASKAFRSRTQSVREAA